MVNGDIVMVLGEYLQKSGTSVYALSKASEVPYTTLLSICRGKANMEECRLGTLRSIARALNVSLSDLIDGKLSIKTGHFIDESIELDTLSLPLPLQKFIHELEDYDQNGDYAFYAAADTMLLMADRYLNSGVIDSDTYEKLACKYPIG